MGIAARLIEERERLGLSQAAFAARASMTDRAQRLYEKGERHPDSEYLAAIAAAGADVLYILTGERSRAVAEVELLPQDEQTLVAAYRACTPEARRNLIATAALLSAGHAAPAPARSARPRGGARTTTTTVTARGGHAAGRDLQINNTRPEGVHARKAKRRKPAG